MRCPRALARGGDRDTRGDCARGHRLGAPRSARRRAARPPRSRSIRRGRGRRRLRRRLARDPPRRLPADPPVHAARGGTTQVPVPGALPRRARERRSRLGTSRGATGGHVRRGARKGSRETRQSPRSFACRSWRRAAPFSSGSARTRTGVPSRLLRSVSEAAWTTTRTASSSCARSSRHQADSRAGPAWRRSGLSPDGTGSGGETRGRVCSHDGRAVGPSAR